MSTRKIDPPRDESGRVLTRVGGTASASVDWRMPTERRNAFRELIRQLNPAEKPQRALEQGLYVEPDSSISERIATRLELSPASTHMLIGGIGSGKTTQLLRVRERLEPVGDVRAFFVDVFQRQQPESQARPGVLLALAGLEVESASSSVTGAAAQEIEMARKALVRIARGRWMEIADAYMEEEERRLTGDFVWKPGILAPLPEQEELIKLDEAIRTVCAALPFQPVVLFDGLDRVVDVSQFISLLSTDLPMLKRAGIGVVAVAPQHARVWNHGAAQELFDEVHLHGAASIQDKDGIGFLVQVLLARTANSELLLPPKICTMLAEQSGGIVRDLLSLARAAAEEAYRLGADTVEAAHVRTAADQFGRNLVVGISDEMIDRLKSLPSHGARFAFSFTPATDIDVRLLLRRLIIEIPPAPVRYILHPTIVPLIAGLRGRS